MDEAGGGRLFLSRLRMNVRSRAAQSDLSDRYGLHRTIMRAFPQSDGAARARFGVLYRLDHDDSQARVTLLVQSSVEPAWDYLFARDDYLLEAPETKETTRLYDSIEDGSTFRFRLRANPTKRVFSRDDKLRGKRVDLRSDSERVDWLRRRARSGGFEIATANLEGANGNQFERLRIIPEGSAFASKGVGGSKLKLTHGSVLYEGLCVVVNSQGFRRATRVGIGPGKAFGFGLLSIARAL